VRSRYIAAIALVLAGAALGSLATHAIENRNEDDSLAVIALGPGDGYVTRVQLIADGFEYVGRLITARGGIYTVDNGRDGALVTILGDGVVTFSAVADRSSANLRLTPGALYVPIKFQDRQVTIIVSAGENTTFALGSEESAAAYSWSRARIPLAGDIEFSPTVTQLLVTLVLSTDSMQVAVDSDGNVYLKRTFLSPASRRDSIRPGR